MTETITHVAIVHPDGVIYQLPCPYRHHDVIKLLGDLNKAGVSNTRKQGFITSSGRYVDRIEGRVLALKSGQITETTHPTQLFSEDLW